MIAAVEAARKDGNSLGGRRHLRRARVPGRWGEPVFDRLRGRPAKA